MQLDSHVNRSQTVVRVHDSQGRGIIVAHIIKFIERNVTILGSATQPLIIESSLIQINQILDVTDGEQISKLPPVMRMLYNFVGQTRNEPIKVIKVLDGLFVPFFHKVLAIGVPASNTSEIEKIQIKSIEGFYTLYMKIFVEHTNAFSILLTTNNYQVLRQFIQCTF